jgi:ubiquinone/menaquinone biosynthesis C-methylase UbiE
MNEEMERWESKEGVKFLRKASIRKNHIVLDFGCGVGHYTIPAAFVVGSKGIVYAVDKEQQALNELQQKARANNLKNVKVIKTSGQIKLDLKRESIDMVLFYDVLHYFGKRDRKKLCQEAFRALKQDGLLSVYPKHTLGDDPTQEFGKLNSNDVKREIENSGFYFEEKYCGTISHDDSLNQGCVLNFRKDKNESNNSL